MSNQHFRLAAALFLAALVSQPLLAQTSYVSTDGNDSSGTGSSESPWATITHALDNVVDGATILVRPGRYDGRVRIRGSFENGVTVRSEVPYEALLRNNDRVVTAYKDGRGCEGITIEGFDIAHSGPGSSPLVFHVDGGGDESVSRLTIRDNVIHDSYDNDILKVNNSAFDVLIEGNMFFNQTGSDEHIDVNSVRDVVVQDNVFFNDFEGSGRSNPANTGSFVIVKDSNDDDDVILGNRDITIRRNVFLNWQGSTGAYFVSIGQDGKPYHESYDVLVENNLMIGNSSEVMRAAFGVAGSRDVTFRANTINGDLPSLAFAMRLIAVGQNPPNERIEFYNNIWSDPSGTMGAENPSRPNDFSDAPQGETTSFVLNNNLYWNGEAAIPANASETVNVSDDPSPIIADPRLPSVEGATPPRLQAGNGSGAFTTVREAFEGLVLAYGVPQSGSPAFGAAAPGQLPSEDILGRPRTNADLGAIAQLVSLPIEIIRFSGIQDGPSIRLDWRVDGSSGIDLQMRTATSDWDMLAEGVSGTGSFDYRPSSVGRYAFRLKVSADDGEIKYSRIVEQEVDALDGGTGIVVFPSPAFGVSEVVVASGGNGSVDLFDLSGRLVRSMVLEGRRASLDVSGLGPGVYVLVSGKARRLVVVDR